LGEKGGNSPGGVENTGRNIGHTGGKHSYKGGEGVPREKILGGKKGGGYSPPGGLRTGVARNSFSQRGGK